MTNLAPIGVVPKHEAVKAEMIAKLEELLARAKEGEFRSMVIVIMCHDGSYATNTSCVHNSLEIIGALETAKWDVLQDSLAK